MGQCTSKHGVRKEALADLDISKENLGVKRNSSHSEHTKTLASSANVGESENKRIFLGTPSGLPSLEETIYSSDFCDEEEEESFTTADSSSRSMRYPPCRKNSSGVSRKSSSVAPLSLSPDKLNSTSTSYLSPSEGRDENLGSSPSIHDVVKKPGCEMFVIDFEGETASMTTSPKKRLPLGCMRNKNKHLNQSSSTVYNSPYKNSKFTARNDKVSDSGKSSLQVTRAIAKRSPNNSKRTKMDKNVKSNNTNLSSSNVNICDTNKDKSIVANNNRSETSNLKERSIYKDLISNKKSKKDILNQKIKSQESPKHTFLKKKAPKPEKHKNVYQEDGK